MSGPEMKKETNTIIHRSREDRPLPHIEGLSTEIWSPGSPVHFRDSVGAIFNLSGVELRRYGSVIVVPLRDQEGKLVNLLQFYGVRHVRVLGDLSGVVGGFK